ncbi:hypothetical protein DFH94DRAFT_354386 [Russula ochroleuca]|uniref:Uncharacterized protein n=1 Tax=Russula ochroleuca TaxID=152965 RepID=A0A9P5MMY8_9AGAM|nr:hypothetical protein DFH94DRAFT_354386 [Russula ochroleuca]
MSRKQPPSPPEAFPEPFPKSRTTNRTQNEVGGDSRYLQAGPPPGNTYHDPRVPSPSSAPPSLPQSSLQPPLPGPPPIHRSTYPSLNVPAPARQPTYEYASHPPVPQPLSGHHPPFPVPFTPPRQSSYNSSGPSQSMYQPSTPISIPVHPNPTLSMPYYDSSPPNTAYPSSHPEMPRGPGSYLEVHEPEYVSSDEDDGPGPEGASGYIQGRGQGSAPVAGRPRPQRRKQRTVPPEPPELPCRLCKRLSPGREVVRLGGFCSERHKWDWEKLNRS